MAKVDVNKTVDQAKKTVAEAGEKGQRVAEQAKKAVADAGKKGQKVAAKAKKAAEETGAKGQKAAGQVIKAAGDAKGVVAKAKNAAIQAIDVNDNGKVDIEDIIIQGLKVPGIRIDRTRFLRKELKSKYKKDIVDKAIATNPASAGITVDVIDGIADEVIKFERTSVSGISAALGAPGGLVMIATIPADIIQYYGYMLRAAQKMLYLYGFPEIETSKDGEILDSATMNSLIICMGVMYGVAGANKALHAMAQALAIGVEKKLLNAALTKGTIYPIVKSVASWFGKRMTKEVFAGFFKKAIPVVGGVVGGGITFATFKPCCDRLKKSLRNTMLSNPNMEPNEDNEFFSKIIDAEIIEDEE